MKDQLATTSITMVNTATITNSKIVDKKNVKGHFRTTNQAQTPKDKHSVPESTHLMTQVAKDLLTIAKLIPHQFFHKELDDTPHSSFQSHSTTHPQLMLNLHCNLQQAI
jgi:hypothetical protein